MTTYNTYQETKINNPEREVLTGYRKGEFTADLGFNYYHKCNPADYCMTVEKFLADGYRFVEGDIVFDFGDIVSIDTVFDVETYSKTDKMDDRRYILRAAALEEKEPELTKDDSPQGVISAISNRLHNIGCEHQDSELGEELGSMACDIWGVLPMISNEPIEEKKPRTKVEYVKCEFSREWEAVNYYNEEGELFVIDCNGNYINVNDTSGAWYEVVCKNYQSIYRRIETQISWQEELYDYLDNSCEMSDDFDDNFTLTIGSRPLEFNLSDDEFVNMCKLVASLNSVN